MTMASKPFADPALEAIALDGRSGLAPDGDPETARGSGLRRRSVPPGRIGTARRRHHHQLRRRTPLAPLQDAVVVPAVEDPVGPPETAGLRRSVTRSSCRHPHPPYLDEIETAMRLRPLARRALRTARPPLVFIRSRKPCVRRRLIRLGWKVRFMTADPHSLGSLPSERMMSLWKARELTLLRLGVSMHARGRRAARLVLLGRRPGRPRGSCACYSADGSGDSVARSRSLCRRPSAPTRRRRIQNPFFDAEMSRFCRGFRRSLLLLFIFNPQSRRAGR